MNIYQQDSTLIDSLPERLWTPISPFEGHGASGALAPQMTGHGGLDWIFILTTSILFLFAILRYHNTKRIDFLLRGALSRAGANQVLRESSVFNHQTFLPLFFLYISATTLFLYTIMDNYPLHFIVELPPPVMIIIIFFSFLVFFLIKIFALFIGGWVFKNSFTTFEYIHNIFLFNVLVTIVLFPLIYLLAYIGSVWLLWFSTGLLAALFLYRFLRGIGIGLSDSKFSIFHLFLYLCTLEILPLLVMAKILERYIFIG